MPSQGSGLRKAAVELVRGLYDLCRQQENGMKKECRTPRNGVSNLSNCRIVFIGDYPLEEYLGTFEKNNCLELLTTYDGSIPVLQNALVGLDKARFQLERGRFFVLLSEMPRKLVHFRCKEWVMPHSRCKLDIPTEAILITDIKFERYEYVLGLDTPGRYKPSCQVEGDYRPQTPLVTRNSLWALTLFNASRKGSNGGLNDLENVNRLTEQLEPRRTWNDWEIKAITASIPRVVHYQTWSRQKNIHDKLAIDGFLLKCMFMQEHSTSTCLCAPATQSPAKADKKTQTTRTDNESIKLIIGIFFLAFVVFVGVAICVARRTPKPTTTELLISFVASPIRQHFSL